MVLVALWAHAAVTLASSSVRSRQPAAPRHRRASWKAAGQFWTNVES